MKKIFFIIILVISSISFGGTDGVGNWGSTTTEACQKNEKSAREIVASAYRGSELTKVGACTCWPENSGFHCTRDFTYMKKSAKNPQFVQDDTEPKMVADDPRDPKKGGGLKSDAQEMCEIKGAAGLCKIEAFLGAESLKDKNGGTCAKLRDLTYSGSCVSGFVDGAVMLHRPPDVKNSRRTESQILVHVQNGKIQYPYIGYEDQYIYIGQRGSSGGCVNFVQGWNNAPMCDSLKQLFGNNALSKETWQAVRQGKFQLSSLQKNERPAGGGSISNGGQAIAAKGPAVTMTETNNPKAQNEDQSGPVDPGDMGIEFRYVEVPNRKTEIIGAGGPCSHLGFNKVVVRNDFVNERNWNDRYWFSIKKPFGDTYYDFSIDSRLDYSLLIKNAREDVAKNKGYPSEKSYRDNLEIAQCAASAYQQYKDAIYQFHKKNWKKCPGECSPSRLRENGEKMPFSK